jgi:hypothetical protein
MPLLSKSTVKLQGGSKSATEQRTMAIKPDYRNGWQHAGPSLDPHHQHNRPFKDHFAKPATNGAFGLHAPLLLKNGYSPVPEEPGEKRPLGAVGDWNRFRSTPLTVDEIADIATKHPNAGLGVVGGYGGLVPIDIDTDNVDIRMAIDTVLGGPLVAKRGRRGVTVFGRDPSGLIKSCKFRMADSAMIMEVLTTGQVVVPPTVHPETQRPYMWLTECTLFDVSIDDLPVWPADVIERIKQALAPWLPPPREYNRTKSKGATGALRPASPKRMRNYAEAALEGERESLARMPPNSGRNRKLFDAGCKLGKYVHHQVLSLDELEGSILDACRENGLVKEDGPHACEASLTSGLRKAEGDDLPVLEDRAPPGGDAPGGDMNGHAQSRDPADIKSWPIMESKAAHGIVGRIARLATANSEADPAAVITTTLVYAGASSGERSTHASVTTSTIRATSAASSARVRAPAKAPAMDPCVASSSLLRSSE